MIFFVNYRTKIFLKKDIPCHCWYQICIGNDPCYVCKINHLLSVDLALALMNKRVRYMSQENVREGS